MVGFTLNEIVGEPADSAETREVRLRMCFALMLAAVLDCRFADARIHLAAMAAEIDELDEIVGGFRSENSDVSA